MWSSNMIIKDDVMPLLTVLTGLSLKDPSLPSI